MNDSVKDNQNLARDKRSIITVKLEEKARLLPPKPGCYLMKNINEKIIYVGKAKNLRSRVMSYFNQSAKGPKTEILVTHISDFDFIITEISASNYRSLNAHKRIGFKKINTFRDKIDEWDVVIWDWN